MMALPLASDPPEGPPSNARMRPFTRGTGARSTFRVDSTQAFVPLGQASIPLPQVQEGLRTVRFDTDRAYAITYNQTDPLFVIDLAEPDHPRQRGDLFMP
jgi:hypothetical protein